MNRIEPCPEAARGSALRARYALKQGRLAGDPSITTRPDRDEADGFAGIRCPVCEWRPSAASRWSCTRVDAPEGFLDGCGTSWNTFATRGTCPGCGHRWRWTKCMRCDEWSLHDDWYETETPN